MSAPIPDPGSLEPVRRYLALDGARRTVLFGDFCARLKRMANQGDPAQAAEFARRAATNQLDYSSLRKLGKQINADPARTPEVRIALLGGPTTIQLSELLGVLLSAAGIEAVVFPGEYRQFRMELLGPSRALDEFAPEMMVFALDAMDALTPFFPGWTRDEMLAAAEGEAGALANLWRAAGGRWGCGMVQNVLDVEPFPVLGNFAFTHGVSREAYATAINLAMRDLAREQGVHFHDLPALVRNTGAQRWYDPRYYNEAKLPCAPECLPLYAHGLASVIAGVRGKSRKMLVLDLDNTIWGGEVGELGPWGVELGQGSGQGEAFLRFQRYVKELAASGVVLGVCSKNNHADAVAPFESNPNMILRLGDIASFKANWRNKDENLREIAGEVNLGLDALVFVDDNPAERSLVRRLLPQVSTPDMPEDPSFYIQALAGCGYFEKAALTAEDLARSSHYAGNRRRREMRETADDFDSFLASLGMEATLEPVNESNIHRAVQLINKSNQFNLTGIRREQSEVRELAGDAEWATLTASLKDRCGDNGLVSVLLLRKADATLIIESWVMSCRVLRRGLENRILKELVRLAKTRNCSRIEGRYRATAKNGLVENLYERLGFARGGESDGMATWFAVADFSSLAVDSHIA
jgi:FkbH-like protein